MTMQNNFADLVLLFHFFPFFTSSVSNFSHFLGDIFQCTFQFFLRSHSRIRRVAVNHDMFKFHIEAKLPFPGIALIDIVIFNHLMFVNFVLH